MFENSFNVKVGEKIREIRLKHGLTCKELGSAINVSQQQMSRYELGITAITVITLFKISVYFNVNASYFVNIYDESMDFVVL